jgi:hypothetical protein
MIKTSVSLTDEHYHFCQTNAINVSKLLRLIIDEKIKEKKT